MKKELPYGLIKLAIDKNWSRKLIATWVRYYYLEVKPELLLNADHVRVFDLAKEIIKEENQNSPSHPSQ